MKRFGFAILVLLSAWACQPSDAVSDFTGNETTYDLQAGSTYNVTGTVVFKERKNGTITAVISLNGTDGNAKHPVHLHLGDLSTQDAAVALLLNPVLAKTGKSETTFSALGDQSSITYKKLTELAACIKIHLGDTGAQRDIILAAGDIGVSFTNAHATSRLAGIATCKSE
ncbi:MAG: hypothetical protein JNK10_06495 [Cyclobacteriaceae bacterium]|nr:hypothetical protein [Cyclobacteriaceae bacterium]